MPSSGLAIALPSGLTARVSPAPQMPVITVLTMASMAWCFLQVECQHLEAPVGGSDPKVYFQDNDQ